MAKQFTITTAEDARAYLAERGLDRPTLKGKRLIDCARAERRRETAAARKADKSAPPPDPAPPRQPAPNRQIESGRIATVEPDKPQEAKRKQQAAPSAYVGIVGKRIDLKVTYTGTHGQGGPVQLVRCQAGDDTIVWEASERLPMAEGAALRIRATVKEHAQRRGEQLTILDRVKVL